jgi:hypothetical protein
LSIVKAIVSLRPLIGEAPVSAGLMKRIYTANGGITRGFSPSGEKYFRLKGPTMLEKIKRAAARLWLRVTAWWGGLPLALRATFFALGWLQLICWILWLLC